MKKYKNIVKKISLIVLIVSFSFGLIVSFIAINVKTDLLNHVVPDKQSVVDSIIIHFIHGSIPEPDCIHSKKRLGGYLGGHIEIQLDDKVYGFLYDSLPINYIPKKNFNSKYEINDFAVWSDKTKYDMITSVYIPVDDTEKKSLKLQLEKYLHTEPYDYAFWGQRCTSSTAEVLSDVGILNTFSNFESIIAFFYPRTFRNTMIDFAKKNDLKINVQKGIDCHKWES